MLKAHLWKPSHYLSCCLYPVFTLQQGELKKDSHTRIMYISQYTPPIPNKAQNFYWNLGKLCNVCEPATMTTKTEINNSPICFFFF
jgi:hypothetical protein